MGQELDCVLRVGNKSDKGKALLETKEILFRGSTRLKVSFSSLTSVIAQDGELKLKWSQGSAVLEIGAQAEKWAHKILHPKTTSEKVGIKPGMTITAIGLEDVQLVKELGANAKSFSSSKPLKNSDLVFFTARDADDLKRVEKLIPFLASAGALWIVYPKGKPHQIREIDVLSAGRSFALIDVKVVGFSETHTALKFVRPKAKPAANIG